MELLNPVKAPIQCVYLIQGMDEMYKWGMPTLSSEGQ